MECFIITLPYKIIIWQIDGCRNRKNSLFYVGKRCVYVYKGKARQSAPTNPKHKTRLRAIWGKVTRLHGNSGSVRAKFKKNLPGDAMGHRIRIVSHVLLRVFGGKSLMNRFCFRCCTHHGFKSFIL